MNKHLIVCEELETGTAKSYDVKPNLYVSVNGVIFKSGVVSSVEFVKHSFSDRDRIFINLYMGRIEVCTVIATDNYVIEEDDLINTLRIRKVN